MHEHADVELNNGRAHFHLTIVCAHICKEAKAEADRVQVYTRTVAKIKAEVHAEKESRELAAAKAKAAARTEAKPVAKADAKAEANAEAKAEAKAEVPDASLPVTETQRLRASLQKSFGVEAVRYLTDVYIGMLCACWYVMLLCACCTLICQCTVYLCHVVQYCVYLVWHRPQEQCGICTLALVRLRFQSCHMNKIDGRHCTWAHCHTGTLTH